MGPISLFCGLAIAAATAAHDDGASISPKLAVDSSTSRHCCLEEYPQGNRAIFLADLLQHTTATSTHERPTLPQGPPLSRRRELIRRRRELGYTPSKSCECLRQRPAEWIRAGGSSKRTLDKSEREEQQAVRSVLLYYPNLIGYARVILVLTSFYLAETNWIASSFFYVVAFAGDAVDGHIARKFNQASRFGAVLDMVTDRCSTAGLLLVLSRLYDHKHAFAFLVLMFVDLFSHWMHTHSVIDQHHKSTFTLRRRNVLIRTYYDNLPFFAVCCIGAELFYVLLYLLHFLPKGNPVFDMLYKFCYWVCLPACVLKQLVNVAQLSSAARTLALAELDEQF